MSIQIPCHNDCVYTDGSEYFGPICHTCWRCCHNGSGPRCSKCPPEEEDCCIIESTNLSSWEILTRKYREALAKLQKECTVCKTVVALAVCPNCNKWLSY